MEIKVAMEEQKDALFQFEKSKHFNGNSSDMELEMQSWDAPWREEALEFYLKTGWCFVALEKGEILGYLLAQPLLFVQASTQTLWIEYVSGTSPGVEAELLDVAYRWARSKHLQRVLFNEAHISDKQLDGDFVKRKKFSSAYVHSTKSSEA